MTVALRPELEPLTDRLARLHQHRGYPVPFFVAWVGQDGHEAEPGVGEPDFRVMSHESLRVARRGACWVCGQKLGGHKAFVIGPMCAVNRVSAEPPSHRDCAEWSARNCPFLARPHARRRDFGDLDHAPMPGVALQRNPGVAVVWNTRSYKEERVEHGVLFRIGPPTEITWWACGRTATRAEIMASIDSGMPALREVCDVPAAHRALDKEYAAALELLPA